jgi:hypothetical protein
VGNRSYRKIKGFKMETNGLQCRPATIREETEILLCLSVKAKSYTLEGIEFLNLLEVYNHCKKNKIKQGVIKSNLTTWGDVKNLITKTKKEIGEYYV